VGLGCCFRLSASQLQRQLQDYPSQPFRHNTKVRWHQSRPSFVVLAMGRWTEGQLRVGLVPWSQGSTNCHQRNHQYKTSSPTHDLQKCLPDLFGIRIKSTIRQVQKPVLSGGEGDDGKGLETLVQYDK
jgi:hypothetical protein